MCRHGCYHLGHIQVQVPASRVLGRAGLLRPSPGSSTLMNGAEWGRPASSSPICSTVPLMGSREDYVNNGVGALMHR